MSPSDLAWALFTIGRLPPDVAGHGAASVYECLHRVSLIPAYVRMSPQGRLIRSDLARELDRSEKAGFSYAIGQAFTRLFCGSLLGTQWMVHVDRYARRFGVAFSTRSRPDLIGLSPRGWVVAREAKCRPLRIPVSARDQTCVGT